MTPSPYVSPATPPSETQKRSRVPLPTAAEAAAITTAKAQTATRPPAVRIELHTRAEGTIEVLGGGHSDHDGWLARLQVAFGTSTHAFAVGQLNALVNQCMGDDRKVDVAAVNGLLAMVEGAKPQNEIEGALAVQMALGHALTTKILTRASKASMLDQFDSAAGMAVKLTRTFTLQAEALAKLQRRGEQTVRVVHVHPGAQAVVGNVVTNASGANGSSPAGGGDQHESEHRPHAKAELPAPSARPMPPLWGEDTDRVAVPVASRER
jgi:hypothetical protein